MASIVFGEYVPSEIIEEGIIDVEWLDEKKNSIESKKINDIEFSDITYGQMVRVRIKFKNFAPNTGVFLEIVSNNEKCKFKPNIPIMLVKNNEVLSEPFVLPINMYFDEIEEYDYEKHSTKIDNPQKLYVKVLNTTFKTEKKHILKPYSYFRNYEELIGLFKENGNGIKTNEYKPDKDPKNSIQNYEDKFINYNTTISQILKIF